MDSLLAHFTSSLHGWSCPTVAINDDETFDVHLHDGFNFFRAFCIIDGSEDGGMGLILMNVPQQLFGCSISVLCIHPHAAENDSDQAQQCELWSSHRGSNKLNMIKDPNSY